MSDLIEREKAIDAIVDCTVYGNADDKVLMCSAERRTDAAD